jgi:hypothetical protein
MNAFLLALGRDVTSLHRSPPLVPVHPLLQPRRSHDYIPHENWFDDDGLAQIGLVGLPGLPPLLSMHDPDGAYVRDFHAARGLYPSHSRQSHARGADLSGLLPAMDLGRYGRDPSSDTARPSLNGSMGSSMRQTPPVASPLSTSSSASSSHGGQSNMQGSTNAHVSSPYDGGSHYGGGSDGFRMYGDSSNLQVSYDSLRPPSPPSLLLQQPTLGAREGAGLLGTGPKPALFLQTVPRSMQQPEAEKRAQQDGISEASDEAESGEDEVDEDTPVDTRRPSVEDSDGSDVDMQDSSSPPARNDDSDSPDSDAAVHKPGHTLYPLLRREGDPALKLPALALQPRHRPSSSDSPRELSSIYPDLGSIGMARAPSSPSHSSGTSLNDPNTPQRRTILPSIASVVTSPPSSAGSDLTTGIGKIGLQDPPRAAISLPPSTAHGAKSSVSDGERLRHASLIRALLVHINTEYVRKYGVPGQPRPASMERSRTPMEDAMDLDSPVESISSAA